MSTNNVLAAAVKSDWDLRKYFERLRFDKNHHLGLGDIRLTVAQQEEICELVERSYQLPHYFNAPDEDKDSRFCRCGKYLTDDIHLR